MSARHPAAAPELDALDRAILNRMQDDLPLVPRPFAAVAEELGTCEADVLSRLERLRAARVITRFGPFFDAEALGGAFCLCAMAVPAQRFEDVMIQVNAHHAVAHNYERDHRLNMWFVLATETREEIDRVANAIEAETGLPVLRFPKEREFFIRFRVAA